MFGLFDRCATKKGLKTFDLKIHAAVVVWGGGNLFNLDEMESEMIFYKTMKKIFFQLIQYMREVRIY